MKDLAIVLITKNQAWNIGRLIESLLRATARVASKQIWLVDSASTDQTVELAKTYPVNILRLRPETVLTPAAGRYIGYKRSRGRYTLFVDGDMELYPGWLERALRVMEEDSTVAVVTGNVIDLPMPAAGFRDTFRAIGTDEAIEVPRCGGAALYRRAALELVGAFNPYLRSEEEAELCLRIRHAGYRIIQLQHPLVNHYTEPNETLPGVVSRRRRGFYVGAGQVLRYHFGTKLWWPFVRARGFAFAPAFSLMAGILSLVRSAATSQWSWFGYWCLMLVMVVVGDAMRKRSFYRTIVSLVKRLFTIEGTVIGLVMKALAPGSYPATPDVVQEVEENYHDSIQQNEARVG